MRYNETAYSMAFSIMLGLFPWFISAGLVTPFKKISNNLWILDYKVSNGDFTKSVKDDVCRK